MESLIGELVATTAAWARTVGPLCVRTTTASLSSSTPTTTVSA